MTDLQLESLPPLPQCRVLVEIASALWRDGSVLALWLGRLLQTEAPAVVRPYPARAEEIRQLLEEFWIGTHKHRKVLYRRLHLLAITGIQRERALLLRLWYVAQTGRDFGSASPTIHGMAELCRTVEHVQGVVAFHVLGAPLTNNDQICHAIELLRDAVSAAGQRLAETLGFSYPHDLEQMVRQGWHDFLHQETT